MDRHNAILPIMVIEPSIEEQSGLMEQVQTAWISDIKVEM